MISYLISDILFLLRVNPGLPKVSQRGASLSESRRGRWGRTWTPRQNGTLLERSINPFRRSQGGRAPQPHDPAGWHDPPFGVLFHFGFGVGGGKGEVGRVFGEIGETLSAGLSGSVARFASCQSGCKAKTTKSPNSSGCNCSYFFCGTLMYFHSVPVNLVAFSHQRLAARSLLATSTSSRPLVSMR